jgi:hypothetical protein
LQAVPIAVEQPIAIAIPVKQPIAIPVQQSYPVPLKQPVPVPVHPPPPVPLIAANGLGGAIYTGGYAPGHFYMHPPIHLGHGIAPLAQGFGHAFGHGFGNVLAHDYGHDYNAVHADYLHHVHEHKKRKTDKN